MGIRRRRNSGIKQPWQNALPLVPWDPNLGCISKSIGYLNKHKYEINTWKAFVFCLACATLYEGSWYLMLLCEPSILEHAENFKFSRKSDSLLSQQMTVFTPESVLSDLSSSSLALLLFLFKYFILRDIHITLHSI